MKEDKMSSKNERKKGLGRGLSSFLDVDSFEEIVERSNDENNVDIVIKWSKAISKPRGSCCKLMCTSLVQLKIILIQIGSKLVYNYIRQRKYAIIAH